MTEKKFLIIDSRPYGFFSIFLHTIDNIKWAEDNGYIPFVRWGPGRIDVNDGREGALKATQLGDPSCVGSEPNFNNSNKTKNCLYSPTDNTNPWEYYFNQLTERSIEEVLESKYDTSDIFQSGIHDLDVNSLSQKFLIYNLHSYTPLNTWVYLHIDKTCNSNKHNQGIFYKHRKYVNSYIEKITIKDRILNKVNSFEEQHFTDDILGVHIRGTDKKTESVIGQRPPVTMEVYLRAIQEFLNIKPNSAIFVASDNNEAIEQVFKNFKKNKIIVYNCTRMPKYSCDTPVHLSSFAGPEAGEEALIDCLLLSKCSHIICTDSNLSAAALYFNPEVSCTFVNNYFLQTNT